MKRAANGRWMDGAVVALLLAASIFLQAGAISNPATGSANRPVAVLFAPWVAADSAMQRVAATGARIVSLGALPFIVIAEPHDADFKARAAAVGALFTIDPTIFSACFKPEGLR